MNYRYLGAVGVFAAGFLVHALWAGQPAESVQSAAARTVSATSATYPYAKAVCEFGRRGGPECVNPRDGQDAYDWGYWKGRQFKPGDPWGYEYRNCTSYVAWRLARAGVPASLFKNLGNASDWIGEAKGERGVTVSRAPSPGSIATWDVAGVGHVAWVAAVKGSRVTVEDYNFAGTGVYARHVIGLRPSGYIRFPRALSRRERYSLYMRVGVTGAGRMGRPMVDRLIAAGHEVRVLGRTGQARQALREAGAIPVDTAAGAAAGADVVCVCVFDDGQVRQVCAGDGLLAAMRAGSVLVVHTTGSPATARELQEAAPAGVGVVDCPVSGGPRDIAAGAITLLAGGDAGHVEQARRALEAYGDPVLHVGPLGAGQTVKLVNNAVFAANIGLLAQAARLGTRLGLDEKSLLAALTHGSAASRALDSAARAGSVATFAAAVEEFLAKDVAVVRDVAAELGGDLGVLDAAIRAAGEG